MQALAADQAIEGAARYVAQVLTEQPSHQRHRAYLTDYANEAVAVGDAHFWLIGRSDGQTKPESDFVRHGG